MRLDMADSDDFSPLALRMKLSGSRCWQEDVWGETLPVGVFPRTPAPL